MYIRQLNVIPDTRAVQYPSLASEVIYYFQISAVQQKQAKTSGEYYQSSRNRSPQLTVTPETLRSGVVESPKPKQTCAAESHCSSSARLGADDEPKQYATSLVQKCQTFQQLV